MNKERRAIEKDPKRSAVYQEANIREDEWRDGFLQSRNADLARAFGVSVLGNLAQLVEQKRQATTMMERFELGLQEEHASYTPTVELGMTISANHKDNLDALKHEYRDMLSWAIEQDLTTGELPRSPKTRQFDFKQSEAEPNQLIVTRSRKLFESTTDNPETTQTPIAFRTVKRMVFGMPVGAYNALAQNDSQSMEVGLEQQIDKNTSFIYPIRTAYYLLTRHSNEE